MRASRNEDLDCDEHYDGLHDVGAIDPHRPFYDASIMQRDVRWIREKLLYFDAEMGRIKAAERKPKDHQALPGCIEVPAPEDKIIEAFIFQSNFVEARTF